VNSIAEPLAKKIWDYCNFRTELSPADAIVVLCSHDIRIAEYASHLYHQGLAPWLVFSGGLSPFTAKIYVKSEAEEFGKVAESLKVPKASLLFETQSKNTQENLELAMMLLRKEGIEAKRVILVQKPNMLRRVYATATKLFPEIQFLISSHEIEFEDAPHEYISKEMLIHELTGDLQRIKLYAEKGFISPQEIDPSVWDAFERLKQMGYTGNLVR
jgi:uncharacterized SAM-binding protein YcdF (DUF218 family)